MEFLNKLIIAKTLIKWALLHVARMISRHKFFKIFITIRNGVFGVCRIHHHT